MKSCFVALASMVMLVACSGGTDADNPGVVSLAKAVAPRQIESTLPGALAADGQPVPRLLLDGDSIIANQPGSRRFIEDYVGDVSWKPQGYQQALGGQTALEILNGLNDTLSRVVPGQTLVVVGPIGANRAQGSSTLAEISSQIRAIYDGLLRAGATVVAMPTLPDSPAYADAATRQLKLDLAAFVRAQADVTVVDTTGFDPETMKNDGTHPNLTLGAPYLGQQVRAAVLGLLSTSELPTGPSADNPLGNDWNFPGKVTVALAGVSGVGPSGWKFSRTVGTGQWTVSKTVEQGQETVVAEIRNAPDRTNLRLSKVVSFAGVAGDVWELLAEHEVSGSGWLGSRAVFEGNSTPNINAGGNVQGVPGWPLRLRSSGVPLAATKSSSTAFFETGVDRGGSLTVRWRRARIGLRENLASALTIIGTPAAVGQVGSAYSFRPTVTGGWAPYAFSLAAGVLPSGLSLNVATGQISGWPTAPGLSDGLVLRVTDSSQPTPKRADLPAFSLQVVPEGVPFNTVAPPLVGTAKVGHVLQAGTGSWTGQPTGFSFQWLVDGSTDVLADQTGSSMVVPRAVVGGQISVRVTANNEAGTGAPASSAAIGPVVPSATTPWDDSVTGGVPAELSYSPDRLTVSATASITGVRYARGKDGKSRGRLYFELLAGPELSRAGICDVNVSGRRAGLNGINKVFWTGRTLYYTGGTRSMGSAFGSGDVIQVAVDVDAQLIWMRRNGGGQWNNLAGADPASGVGGLSTAGITEPVFPMSALAATPGATTTLRTLAAQWTLAPPKGFEEFTAN